MTDTELYLKDKFETMWFVEKNVGSGNELLYKCAYAYYLAGYKNGLVDGDKLRRTTESVESGNS